MTDDRLWPEEWQRGPRFSGAYSFMRVPLTRDLSKADVAVVGVPFDGGVNHRPGARFGPRAIRNATAQVRPHPYRGEPLWGPLERLRVIDYGDLDVSSPYIEHAVARIEALLTPVYAAGVVPIVLGGDHTISLPVLRAMAKVHGPASLVHFDAHPDFWKPDEARPYHHGTPFRIAADEGLIRVQESIQIGIRGTVSGAIVQEVRDAGMHLMLADELYDLGVRAALEEVHRVVRPPVYVSLDIDAADPAYAPGTGTPEIAGLTSRELVQLVRGLRGLAIAGFDVVEVSPPFDSAEITALLAANLVYEFLELIAAERAAAGSRGSCALSDEPGGSGGSSRESIAARFGEEQYCYLTTTGRVSGLPREIEIWFGARGDAIYLLAGGGHGAHWVMNLIQQPRVTVRIADEEFAGTARLVELGSAEEEPLRELLAAKYQDWQQGTPLTSWARTALPVAIDLVPQQA